MRVALCSALLVRYLYIISCICTSERLTRTFVIELTRLLKLARVEIFLSHEFSERRDTILACYKLELYFYVLLA